MVRSTLREREMDVQLFQKFTGTQSTSEQLLALLGLFGAAAFRLMPSVNRCLTALQTIRFAHSAVSTIYNELADQSFSKDSKSLSPNVLSGHASCPLKFTEAIELKNVTYSYEEGKRAGVSGVNITIPKGFSIGIIG